MIVIQRWRRSLHKPSKTSWPIKWYLAAVVFCWLSLSVFTLALDGAPINQGRTRTQAGICLIFLLRLLRAVHRNERNRKWIVYIVCMILAAPAWLFAIEPFMWWLKRRTGGG